MAYKIIYKKRFLNKLIKLLEYLKADWNEDVANTFINKLQKRLQTLSKQPYIGVPSSVIKPVRSILITKHNRLFYRIKDDTVEVINMYDTRSSPKKNPFR
ncbi:MAG: type II toxin-antitoxin system RelE/ParE family toxin [Ferruginibacter sp.]